MQHMTVSWILNYLTSRFEPSPRYYSIDEVYFVYRPFRRHGIISNAFPMFGAASIELRQHTDMVLDDCTQKSLILCILQSFAE